MVVELKMTIHFRVCVLTKYLSSSSPVVNACQLLIDIDSS